ncbi:MAG TPA: FAD-dependent oxidoreductase [Thermomicrobiales bacterium]|nr:FAD-dependent oxidoreductase [Thermomicrobiales bacterium]
MRFMRVQTPDLEWYKNNVPCQVACPAKTDIPRYISLIAQHRYRESYEVNCGSNLFPDILGRVCSHPCETVCRRKKIDGKPIAIRDLKRVAADFRDSLPPAYSPVRMMEDDGRVGVAPAMWKMAPPKQEKGKVAVVGAGPAGLACAHDLAARGYEVHVYERLHAVGGALFIGIPPYRLPRKYVYDMQKDLEEMGVTFHMNCMVGRDVPLRDLLPGVNGHAALVLAIGCIVPNPMNVPGEDLDGVEGGSLFMERINLHPDADLPKRVLVLGGGFTAIDCVRSSIRLGSEKVWMSYRRTINEMGATEEEVEGAREEGIEVLTLTSCVEVLGDERGKVVGAKMIWNELGDPDASGRRSPVPIPGSEFVIDCDLVVPAYSQTPDLDTLIPADLRQQLNLRVNRNSTVPAVDKRKHTTAAPGIYTIGDLALGPRTVIEAIAEGRECATAIDNAVVREQGEIKTLEPFFRAGDYTEIPRQKMPSIPPELRKDFLVETDLGYTPEQGDDEAKRCLQCQINIQIDPNLCIECFRCVEYCPYGIIHVQAIHQTIGDVTMEDRAAETYGRPWDELVAEQVLPGEEIGGIVFALDEELCIRCGICENVCPTNALSMKNFETCDTGKQMLAGGVGVGARAGW